jgi:C-terminal processing protease CtpA/Prc
MSRKLAVALAVAFAASPGRALEPKLIGETVESVADTIHREYFDPVIADRVDATLRQRLAARRYAHARSLSSLAERLNRDLFAITADKHLAVSVVPDPSPTPRAVGARSSNGGVQRAEILDGNIGYLNLTAFYRPEEARGAIAAAMAMLRNADALIIDMRNNGGGSPDTVAFLLSYLFDQPGLPLFEIVPRSGVARHRYTTEESAVPERDGARPVYVLTAARTFSAGEGFAFLLQERHRAEVVGEKTAGAANPGRPYRINERIDVTIPNGRVVSALRGGNWEGTGVTPDVPVVETEALRVAHARARRGKPSSPM